MALFENFPYTNLQQLNLDWLIDQLNKISESSVLSVNGQTGIVTLYENAQMLLPNVPEDSWSILRMCDGTHRGILFGNDDKAYIVHGSLMAQIYSQNNQPPYPVTKVNGMYGEVELYTEQYVRLPDLTDQQMQNWTFFRMLNNVSHGIQFNDDGTASIINGQQRYVLYTSQNPPAFPVDSVNGKTGTVVLFTDVNGAVGYPAIDDPNIAAWSLERNVNGTVYGLKFNDDGSLALKIGAAEYSVYTSNDPQELYVTDPEDAIQQVAEDSTQKYWGLIRDTTEGSIGLMFDNTDPDDPEAFVVYTDSNDQTQTLKILTPADIPATGVVSVNNKSGIVTLYGNDLEMTNTDSRTVPQAIDDAMGLVGYVENTNTASDNYTVGDFIIWNDEFYRVSSDISQGDTLSLSNLTKYNNIGAILKPIRAYVTRLMNSYVAERFNHINVTDLNACQSELGLPNNMGLYTAKFYDTASNIPSNHAGIVLGWQYTANSEVQMAFCLNERNLYVRYKSSGTWTSWQLIA